MNNQYEYPKCNKKGCTNDAAAVLTVFTENGPLAVASCKSHLLTMSSLIDLLVVGLIENSDKPPKTE